MTLLTEQDRVIAEILADKGLSFGEIAHRLLERRVTNMHNELTKEVAALFGRRI